MAERREPTNSSDPFRMTADPNAYVARGSTERVLEWVEERVRSSPEPVLLCGPPGVGKTLLLRVIAERLRVDFETLYLPYPMLSPAEMWSWIEEALSAPDDSSTANDNPTRPLLLLVDSAESLPISTARSLAAATRIEHAGVRLVMALVDGDFARALARALGSTSTTVHLNDDMSDQELETYVRTRLEQAGAGPEEQDRFDRETLEHLHRESQGNPARVHELADSVLRGRQVEAESASEEPEDSAVGDGSPSLDAVPGEVGFGRRAGGVPPSVGAARAPVGLSLAALSPLLALLRAHPRWVVLATVGVALMGSLLFRQESSIDLSREEAGRAGASPPVLGGASTADAPGLVPTAVMVPVNINAQPWALIEIDGVPVGETPIADLPTRPGVHRISAHLPDGRVVHQVVEISRSSRHIAFR